MSFKNQLALFACISFLLGRASIFFFNESWSAEFLDERNKPSMAVGRLAGSDMAYVHTLSAQSNTPALHIYFTADLHLVATTNSHSSGVIVFSHYTVLYILQHNDKLNKTFIFSLKPINQVKAWTFGLGSMCTSSSDRGEFSSGLNLCVWFSLQQLPGKMFGAEQEA